MGLDEKKIVNNYLASDDEEETLSLSDLPVDALNVENPERNQENRTQQTEADVENFEFGSSAGSFRMESEMCVADEVFLHGQILPLRPSVSSDNRNSNMHFKSRSGSRSESMDHSSSCRSSISSRNHHFSMTTYKPRMNNPFYSHPSPNPKIWFSRTKPVNVLSRRSRRASGLFRLGISKTPAMERQELKFRSNSISTNSSGSSGNVMHGKNKKKNNNKTQRFLFESCKCSMDVLESVSSRIVVTKNEKKEKKFVGGNKDNKGKEKANMVKGKKHDMYHRRTFEWLQELSIADVPVVY